MVSVDTVDTVDTVPTSRSWSPLTAARLLSSCSVTFRSNCTFRNLTRAVFSTCDGQIYTDMQWQVPDLLQVLVPQHGPQLVLQLEPRQVLDLDPVPLPPQDLDQSEVSIVASSPPITAHLVPLRLPPGPLAPQPRPLQPLPRGLGYELPAVLLLGVQKAGTVLCCTVLYCTVLTWVRSRRYSRIMASSSRSLAHTMRWPAASSRRASCCLLRSAIQATTLRTRRSVLASSLSMSVLR